MQQETNIKTFLPQHPETPNDKERPNKEIETSKRYRIFLLIGRFWECSTPIHFPSDKTIVYASQTSNVHTDILH